ncbi:hypothetical protein [Falsirhodobacter sp. 1013]|uniref:aldose epimerase family protein n=1 Tax=Falsirhodobacter sp. 1013 TaxID=3417566 RepID=UPI003EB73C9D
MTDLTLRSGPLSASIRPAAGGRIAALRHDVLGDLIVPMDAAPFDPEFWPKAGAYPLIPFHNRIRDGRFTWQGQVHRLPLHPAEPNALHGFASRREWRAAKEGSSIHMVLEHAADEHWPWAISATQVISLIATGMTIGLSVTNLSDAVMPAGLGWHPFFPPCRVTEDAARRWPMDERQIPEGTSTSDTGTEATRHLSGWTQVEIILDNGARMRLTASSVMSHLVVHQTAQYACVEPVSHLAGALALSLETSADRLRPLAPNETLSAEIRLDIL